MNNYRLHILFLMSLAGMPAMSRGTPIPDSNPISPLQLTLPAAYALAITQSEALAIGEAEWQAAEARYRQVRSEFRPELDLAGSAKWDQVDTDGPTVRTTRAGLHGSYEIFNGFRSTHVAAARASLAEAGQWDLQRERQLLFEDVSDVFYQILASERELETLGEEIHSLESRLDELKRRVTLGRSRPAEVLSTQTQLADGRVSLERIRSERDVARELLVFLVGPMGATAVLLDETQLPSPDDVTRFMETLDKRPDILSATERVQAANSDTKAAASDRNLSIQAGGNLYGVSDPGDSGDWDIGLTMSLPVFDGGLRRANQAEKGAMARVSQLELAQLRRVADRDVRMTYRDVTGLLAQWVALQMAVRAADENAATQKMDYDMGRASNLDVLIATTQLQSLRRRAAVLECQAKAAMVHLHVAAGRAIP